ncbi:MAG: hypothetical protein MUO68_21405, partial [Desulfobacteraceae bacterium]|nr:hypothetical protein [Desulfobacteraceae bacterium]
MDIGLTFPFPPKIDRVLVTVQQHPKGCEVDVVVHGGNPPEGFPVRENDIYFDLGGGADVTLNEAYLEIQKANLGYVREKLAQGFLQNIGQSVNRANTEVGLVHLLIAGPKGDRGFRP